MIRHLGLRLAATAFTLGTVLSATPSHARPVAAQATMPHISVTSVGQGSPVILLPGLSTPRAVWNGVVPALARTHRVFVVQVNGFGGDAPGRNVDTPVLDGIVADLHALIHREKIAGAAVVGHSMGGLAALMLAKAHPADVGRLMIVDALPFVGTIFSPQATVAMVEPRARAMRDAQIARYGQPADLTAAKAVGDALALKPASRAQVATWAAQADPRVSARAMYEDMTTDLRPAMGGIATPITVVYPWSAAGPAKEAARAVYAAGYATAPHVDLVDVGDAGHFVMLDQPAAFQAALDAFLNR